MFTQYLVKNNNMENKEKWNWSLSIGFYPGVLIGIRTYEQEDVVQHVLYLPFIDIAFEYIKEEN